MLKKKSKKKKFAPRLDDIQKELEQEKLEKKPEIKKEMVGTAVSQKDPRLDKVIPLLVDIIVKLLGSAGMARYRLDLVSQVKEIMEGEDGNKED